MKTDPARKRAMEESRSRILDVALEVLGASPQAGMGDIAAAAGVVRRTVYGYFPSRSDLVHTLTRRAVKEIAAVLDDVDSPDMMPDRVWVEFIRRIWPLAHRYRVLLALRRGEYGAEIHALLAPVDASLAELVTRGQKTGAFGEHLPAALLSQLAYGAVFSIADDSLDDDLGPDAATITSLLLLGVPETHARHLLAPRS